MREATLWGSGKMKGEARLGRSPGEIPPIFKSRQRGQSRGRKDKRQEGKLYKQKVDKISPVLEREHKAEKGPSESSS